MRVINLNDLIGFRIQPKARRAAYARHLRDWAAAYESHESFAASPYRFSDFLAPDKDGIHWGQAWDVIGHLPLAAGGGLPYEIVLPDDPAKPSQGDEKPNPGEVAP